MSQDAAVSESHNLRANKGLRIFLYQRLHMWLESKIFEIHSDSKTNFEPQSEKRRQQLLRLSIDLSLISLKLQLIRSNF